jgi:hypothetical protein
VKRLSSKWPQSENLKIDDDQIRIEHALYGFEVHYGTQAPFEFENREHAECLAEALRNHPRQNIRTKEILGWRLPITPAGSKKLLELLARLKKSLNDTTDQIASEEEALNELVFRMYGLNKGEQKVIDDFLLRYSSHSKAETEEPESELPDNAVE